MTIKNTLQNIIQICCALLLIFPILLATNQPAQAAQYAEVVISEIMNDPFGTEPDNEWVELYNPSSQAVDITGWVLTDASSFPNTGTEGKCVLIGTVTIPALGFIVVSPTSPNPNLSGVPVTACTISGNFEVDNLSDNLALFTDDSVDGELVFGTLGLDANGNPDSNLNFPALSGRQSGRSMGLKNPMAGWSGSDTSSTNDWALEINTDNHTAAAPNMGWAGQLTTPHTITLDGTVDTASEWMNGELLGAADGDPTFTTLNAQTIADTVKYYVTWDASNIYVGIIAPQITTNRQHYNVVVDVDPFETGSDNAGLTASAADNCNTSFEANGKADYAFQTNPTDGFTAGQVAAGSWQSWVPTSSSAVRSADNTQAEFRIAKNEVGITSETQPIGLYLYVCNDSGNIVAAWPPENEINPIGAVAFTTRTVFDATGAIRSPRDEATHIGYQTRNLNAVGTYTFFDNGGYLDVISDHQNWHARLMIENASGVPTDPNCLVTVKVHANYQATRLGGGIRRAYGISPDENCDGLFARLSLKYEDGSHWTSSLNTDNDVNQTPSELRGLNENALVFFHNTGGDTWVVEDNLTRSTLHNRVAHQSGHGTSTFSPWGFGYANNEPTAVSIISFKTDHPTLLIPILLSALALLLISSALLLFWPRLSAARQQFEKPPK